MSELEITPGTGSGVAFHGEFPPDFITRQKSHRKPCSESFFWGEGADLSSPLGALWPNAGQARQTGGRLACPAFLRGSCSLKPLTPEGGNEQQAQRPLSSHPCYNLPTSTSSRTSLCVLFPFFSCRKMAVEFLAHERIWFEKFKYDEAERRYYEQMNGPLGGSSQQQQVKVCRRKLSTRACVSVRFPLGVLLFSKAPRAFCLQSWSCYAFPGRGCVK